MFLQKWLIKRASSVVAVMLAVFICVAVYKPPTANAAATIPYKINFQGRLTDNNGNVVANGSYNIKFTIYNALTGGTNLWQEYRQTTNRVVITNGLFDVRFGDVTALSPSLFNSATQLYLEIELPTPATATCSTASCGSFTEGALSPRQPIAASPYAFNSDTIDGIDGSSLARNDTANTFNGNQQINGQFTTTSAASGSVAGIIKGASGQSVNLLELQNSSGVVLSSFNSGGNLNVGTDTSAARLTVKGATSDNSTSAVKVTNSNGDSLLQIDNYGTTSFSGLSSVFGSARSAFSVKDSTATAAGVGSGISFDAIISSGGTTATLGNIKAIKENATDGNSLGSLVFTTNPNSFPAEAMRISGAGNVSIGNTNNTYKLDVSGDLNLSSGSALRINGVSICTSAGCTGGGGGSGIDNGTSIQTGANFAIQSAATGSKTAVLKAITGQTADFLDIQDSSGVSKFTIDKDYGIDTAGAFAINAGGNPVPNVEYTSYFGAMPITTFSGSTIAKASVPTGIAFGVKAAASQTADIMVIQDSAGATLSAFKSDGGLTLGQVDPTATLLTLDTKNTAGDPTGTDGAMYYNSDSKNFRCKSNAVWNDCNFESLRSEWMLQEDWANISTTTLSSGSHGWTGATIGTTGTASKLNVGTSSTDYDRFGVLQLATAATTASTGWNIRLDITGMTGVPSNMVTEFNFAPVSANAAAGKQQILYLGLHNGTSSTTAPTDGMYFRYNTTTAAGNWSRCTQATCVDTGVARTTTAGQYERFKIQTNAAGTSVEFFINEASVGSTTTNLPTQASGDVYGPSLTVLASVTAPTSAMQWKTDYFQIQRSLTTLR